MTICLFPLVVAEKKMGRLLLYISEGCKSLKIHEPRGHASSPNKNETMKEEKIYIYIYIQLFYWNNAVVDLKALLLILC